jgi:AcrR family transcriptional regulator
MTRITKGTAAPRPYRSELRETQAAATRDRILDAAIRVMARGLAGVSIPAVAREAGVSVPTVYRHFATKATLLESIYPFLMRRSGVDRLPMPRTIGEVRGAVRAIFERLETLDDVARVAALSPGGDEARHASIPGRLDIARGLAELQDPRLTATDRERIARLTTVLVNSGSLRMWRTHLGLSLEEAADDIDWILRAAVAAAVAE